MFLQVLLFDGTMYHSWYFPVVIIGIVISYLLIKKFDIKKGMLDTVLGLYIIGVLGDNYLWISDKNSIFRRILFTYIWLIYIYKKWYFFCAYFFATWIFNKER